MGKRIGQTGLKRIFAVGVAIWGSLSSFGQERARGGLGEGPRGQGERPEQMEKVDLPEPEVRIFIEGSFRHIESNGVPNHETGSFPGRGNPHAILPQQHKWKVPAKPEIAEEPTSLQRHPFGVALNGIPIDPGTAEYWNRDPRSGWRYEALTGHVNLGIDLSNAHVQSTGAYHYHGVPHGVLHSHDRPDEMTMIGYAADGFPTYANFGYVQANDPASGIKEMKSSWKIKEGPRPSGSDSPGGEYDGRFTADWEYVEGYGDLDALNGRFGTTPEYPEGIYHYYITEQFPYVPRMYKGKPDESFARRAVAPRGGTRGPGGPRGPRGENGPRGSRGPRPAN